MAEKGNCTCQGCKEYAELPVVEGAREIGPPRAKPDIPPYFKWKPMLAANKYWTYLVTCKICKWEKFSDYWNVQDWLWVHFEDNCQKPYKKWNR